METRTLAIELGLIEVIEVEQKYVTKNSKQEFDFLFVLDFESTCWESADTFKSSPEIIEFSVVLYDVKKNEIISEFQQYVMPMEMPELSEFCSSFTGITQQMVDNGVPLNTCIMLFMKWLKDLMNTYNLQFSSSSLKAHVNKCIFVTWSDWDLGNCLLNECRRKRISKPEIFCKWIDIKTLYKEYYSRKPKGLNGAMSELGLKFEGTEHSGLHDARNTAYLAGRMIADGVLLRITKDLSII